MAIPSPVDFISGPTFESRPLKANVEKTGYLMAEYEKLSSKPVFPSNLTKNISQAIFLSQLEQVEHH